MVKGKGSPILLAKKLDERRAGSRHQRRAHEAKVRKANAKLAAGEVVFDDPIIRYPRSPETSK